MPPFSLSIRSFTPPDLPEQPAEPSRADFRSPLLHRSVAAATSPLRFTVSLPSARDKDPLYPASHVQMSYWFEGTGEIFIPNFITSKDLVPAARADEEPGLYSVQVAPDDVVRPKVNGGQTSAAEVRVHAWKGEKFLGKWDVGRIEGLGIVGLKPAWADRV